MNTQNPDWVLKYRDIGWSENWVNPILNKYDEVFYYTVSEKTITPENYINVNFINFIEDENFIKNIQNPEQYTIFETIYLVIQLLDCYSKQLPTKDKNIYRMYENLKESDKFNVDFDFANFYVFCERLNYNNIKNTEDYQILSNIISTFIYEKGFPDINSIWKIPYKNGKIVVQVKNIIKNKYNLIHNPSYVKVNKIIEQPEEKIKNGDKIYLYPKLFNNGKLVK